MDAQKQQLVNDIWGSPAPVANPIADAGKKRAEELRARATVTRQTQRKENRNIGEKILDFTGGKEIAQGLGQALALKGSSKDLEDTQSKQMNTQGQLLQRIREKKSRGEDTSRLEKSLEDLGYDIYSTGSNAERMLNPNELTTKQVLGDALQLGTTVASVGSYGAASKVPTAALTLTKSTGIVRGAAMGALKGAGIGAAEGTLQGAAQGLQNDGNATDVIKSAVKGGAFGAAAGGVIGGVTGGISGGIRARHKATSPMSSADEAYEAMKPKLTPTEKAEKARLGLIDFDARGNYIEKPSAEDMRLSEVAKDIFTPKGNTAERIGRLNKAISETAEQEVVPLLRNSQVNGTLDDVYRYIDQIQPTKQFSKELGGESYMAFNVVKNDAKNSIANAVKSEMKKNPGANFNEVLWKARQKIDDIIEAQFGSRAFDDPMKNAAREASVKARGAIQEFLVDSVSGRDMMKMAQARDLAESSLKRGIEMPDNQTLAGMVDDIYKQLGGTDKITNESSKKFADSMKYMTDLFSIRDNYLAPRLAKEDFSALARLIKAYPRISSALKYTATAAVGGGLAAAGLNAIGD